MNNLMLVIKTLGIEPGSIILSIGVVAFDPMKKELSQSFYSLINTQSCKDHGLTASQSTIDWWGKQSPDAQSILKLAESGPGIMDVLTDLNSFFCSFHKPLLWANGSDFDNILLASAFDAVGIAIGISPFNNRCYRTLKSLWPQIALQRSGTYHNALDDAKSQANHACAILRDMYKRV